MTTTKRRLTLHALHREAELTSGNGGALPHWLFSPPTPTNPERIAPGSNGKPPADATAVVECDGRLYDRIILHRPHAHTLRLPDRTSPMLRVFFARLWQDVEDDSRPENRDRRAAILALAAEAGAGGEADFRRAWAVIDWMVHVQAPAMFELAGFPGHARAYRGLPAITGSELPRGAAKVFRAAHLELNRAATIAVKQCKVRRDDPCPETAFALKFAACTTFPDLGEALREDLYTKMAPLGLGLLAAVHASDCVRYARRVAPSALKRAAAALKAAERELVAEVVGMRDGSRAAA
ncbi:hypothetical protein AnaeK_2011 [Anaeromyxobacter sp. K]|uniref:hypothetical protein n=1 Tax=Anaeromyxobacter sp. (strain K) TaxID=447217 RepID=UPI00015F8A35|nr:hypothetical protein [Anaeromyxobacter sp. K]ACG73239.1 hypothetical protein AnaeK_2011 [Anaeromyxobacter sp. K]